MVGVDLKACTRQEPTQEVVSELVTACGGPGVRVRAGDADGWPGTVESDRGVALCNVSAPEVLADPEDVDDLAAGARLDHADLPLWLVTVTPSTGSGERGEVVVRALATALVARCGGWAFAGGAVVATGPDTAELADPDDPPPSFVAVTPAEPAAELIAKVRERHVAVAGPVRVETLDALAGYVGPGETDGRTPPLWVTTLTADASCRASVELTLAVAAAEFVLAADADVFDGDGKRLPLPHTAD